MIRPEQLAQALDHIPPRDRELLSLSLRRRVPDEALGRLYECEPAEVARLRARAIERLADEMELQRGEDLGAVLKALLAPETWSAAAASLGEEFAIGAAQPRLTAVPRPEEPTPDPEAPPPPKLAPVRGQEADSPPAAAASPAEEPDAAAPEEEAAPPEKEDAPRERAATEGPARNEPVLEMLAARHREAPDPPKRAVPLAFAGLGIAALVAAAGLIGATQFGDGETTSGSGGEGDGTRHFVPERGGPLAAPFPTDPKTVSCYTTATVSKATVLFREPGGARRMRITARTEWNSPRVLGVVSQRGGWLGVQASELGNGEVAWLPRRQAKLDCVTWSMHADLSKRTLFVRHGGRTVRKLRVAIGRQANPTPQGRFSVTDKLRVTDPGSPYGCCVLALTGHQVDLPPYWPGGDRLAVHATSDEDSIGKPVSLGCLRADAKQARWLINTIPLGAPIFIRA